MEHNGADSDPRSRLMLSNLRRAVAAALALMLLCGGSAPAAPRPKPPAARPVQVLSFDLVTRFAIISSQGLDSRAMPPEHNLQAHVRLAGGKMRIETRSVDQPRVVLYNPPYIYTLLPRSHAGTRYKMTPAQQHNRLNPQTLLQNPSAIRSTLLQQGAHKVGSTRLQGTVADLYVSNTFMGRPQSLKAWLRHSDSLPLRLEAGSRRMKVVAVWSGYAHTSSPASLFALPRGYAIREAAGPPRSF